ncbi:TIGR03086 family metal-binding protein [Saccharopolyspora griseoalba]|uniref:TIGR03086 family metal-binding protein n=1 Tax=Saccharopolyspora griseoalba TaxID=1431848 RepID=A0ABW2LPC6_9PSEU
MNAAAVAPRALALFVDAVERTPPEAWDRTSNLGEWSVRELVGHATGSADKLVRLSERGEFGGFSEPADYFCDDPAARLREIQQRLREVLGAADLEAPCSSPQGEVPLRRAMSFPVADLAIHSWDLHRSRGADAELPEDVLVFCREMVDAIPDEVMRRPGSFGPARPAPESATPTARLMAHLGREV